MTLNRRQFLATGLAGGATALVGGRAHAQPEALRIGVLTPLTGGGTVYGTTMSHMYALVADEINKAGGRRGQADPALHRGRPDQPRRRGARRAQARGRQPRARHSRHLVERGHAGGGADRGAGPHPAVLRVELARHLDVQGRRLPLPHRVLAGGHQHRVRDHRAEARVQDRGAAHPEQPLRHRPRRQLPGQLRQGGRHRHRQGHLQPEPVELPLRDPAGPRGQARRRPVRRLHPGRHPGLQGVVPARPRRHVDGPRLRARPEVHPGHRHAGGRGHRGRGGRTESASRPPTRTRTSSTARPTAARKRTSSRRWRTTT